MTEFFECYERGGQIDKKTKNKKEVRLMNDCDSMSLYIRRGDVSPSVTSNIKPPIRRITSRPIRLKDYNRRGPAILSTPTSPPVLSNPRSVLKKTVSKEELQQPGGPYIKKFFTIDGDELGWGFVVRGNGPCHIQTVEPDGPAAVAGMKVCQFVVSVNNQNVLDMDYKTLSLLILKGPRTFSMEVMEEKKD